MSIDVRGDPGQLAGLLKRFEFLDAKKLGVDFSTRLVLQKVVYLMQEWAKIPFGYPFHWWHRGPYSSSLASDLYSAIPLYDTAVARSFADQPVEERFGKILLWVTNQARDRGPLETPRWFELLGSVLFLQRSGYDKSAAKPILAAKIPQLDDPALTAAWDLMSAPPQLD